MKTLNLKKYKRFFAFGCSFTSYKWPTWADIIGSNVPYYENWGSPGKGNHYIFNAIVECNAIHRFNQDDLVIVMWSKVNREDRYHNGSWIDGYPAVLEETYGKKWCMKYAVDERANLIRDLAMIKASQSFLDNSGCDWTNLIWSPLVNLNIDTVSSDKAKLFISDGDAGIKYWAELSDALADITTPTTELICSDVVNIYRDIFLKFEKNMYGIGLHKAGADDMHPTPREHLDYIKYIWPNIELNSQLADWDITQPYHRTQIKRL